MAFVFGFFLLSNKSGAELPPATTAKKAEVINHSEATVIREAAKGDDRDESGPIKSMEALIARGKKELSNGGQFKVKNAEFDVKKTPSLLEPFEATLKLNLVRNEHDIDNCYYYKVTLIYTFKDDRWVFRSGLYDRRSSRGAGFRDAILRGHNYLDVKRGVDAFGAHDMDKF